MAGEHILVVDDEKNIRLMMQECLEQAGYQVDSAVDGEHALEKIAARGYDLVLLDLRLPGMSGMEVLRQARGRRPDQPVVMITAHGTIETAVEAMKLGAVDYLQKPFTPDEIQAIVARVLSRRRLPVDEPAASFATCVEQAKLLIQRGQPREALPFLHRAVSLEPEHPEPYNLMGAIHELLGEPDHARKMYRAALAIDPSYRPALTNLHRITQWDYHPETPELGEAGAPPPATDGEGTGEGPGGAE
ncbi:response regulator [Caldinitratiruptor microaerophilus]|uniref:Stage 0 sporulation protein A homolog n=1 Tax=Caldinitratiruptor microaerophilus TaxID=671077 RepID=A0AA35G798_9FIRM|nr:response regulator [Caldinitratiruptor microaerophilus]BDG59088.1 hypothetical protein caldi_01780 [Caldinitratiruptor microaerophilus]